jgi:hypothetical protein
LPATQDILDAMNRLIGGTSKWPRAVARASACGALIALLAACAGTQDDSVERFFVAPGKYTLYNCAQLAQAATANEKRQRELEALIARAGPGAAGGLVAATAYKPEYYQKRGEMTEMRRTAAEKNCKFVPGQAASNASPMANAGMPPQAKSR